MPTNLPSEAKHKWHEVTLAKHPADKLRKLQEFLSLVPKHKGTEKLRAQVKRQIANLRREIEESRRRKVGGRGSTFFIEKEGAAQIIIVGATNVGRSSLLRAVTNAKVKVSAHPFATVNPTPGSFYHEDLNFQIVEAPPFFRGMSQGKGLGQKTLALVRNADCILIMVDLSSDPVSQYRMIIDELESSRITLSKPKTRVIIEKTYRGAGLRIIVSGQLVNCNLNEVASLLKSYGVIDGIVKIYGKATLDDVEDAIFGTTAYKPAIIVANKLDVPKAEGKLKELKAILGFSLPLLAISCKTGVGLKKLGEVLFKTLEIVRVYTKEPGEKNPSPKPFILKKGETVIDLARKIHSDFYNRFNFAKVWSERLPYSPRKVGQSFLLEDGDIVELHLK